MNTEWNNWQEFFDSGTIMSLANGNIVIGWGAREWLPKPAPESEKIHFYFPDFFLTKKLPWFTQEHTREFTNQDLLTLFEQAPSMKMPFFNWQNPYKNFYNDQFHVLQHLFAENKLDKAVPFVYDTSETKMTPGLLFHCIKNALNYLSTRPAYIMGFWENGQGVLAVSPELLFEIDTKNVEAPKIHTVALGGTFFTNDLSMLKNDKLTQEHQIIVDRITQNLTKYGNVRKGTLSALQFASIYHLITKIQVDLIHGSFPKFIEVVEAMHPTPALGASPLEEGKKWLEYYETFIKRRYYGAPSGYEWKNGRECKCYVNIRNIQWTNGQLLIAGGGGVIQKSDLSMEWTEIQNKIKSIKNIFDIN